MVHFMPLARVRFCITELQTPRLVSFLMFLTFVLNWKVPVIALQAAFQQTDFMWLSFTIITVVLFIILNLIAAIGLFFLKKWSFSISYLAIIFSTVFFSISYIPLISKISNFFLPQTFHPIPVILINSLILIYLIYLDVSYRRDRRAA